MDRQQLGLQRISQTSCTPNETSSSSRIGISWTSQCLQSVLTAWRHLRLCQLVHQWVYSSCWRGSPLEQRYKQMLSNTGDEVGLHSLQQPCSMRGPAHHSCCQPRSGYWTRHHPCWAREQAREQARQTRGSGHRRLGWWRPRNGSRPHRRSGTSPDRHASHHRSQ